jgi:hypothetical protein
VTAAINFPLVQLYKVDLPVHHATRTVVRVTISRPYDLFPSPPASSAVNNSVCIVWLIHIGWHKVPIILYWAPRVGTGDCGRKVYAPVLCGRCSYSKLFIAIMGWMGNHRIHFLVPNVYIYLTRPGLWPLFLYMSQSVLSQQARVMIMFCMKYISWNCLYNASLNFAGGGRTYKCFCHCLWSLFPAPFCGLRKRAVCNSYNILSNVSEWMILWRIDLLLGNGSVNNLATNTQPTIE